jgi:hypothetical protein
LDIADMSIGARSNNRCGPVVAGMSLSIRCTEPASFDGCLS